MFENTPTAPPDPIFGLTAAFRQDTNPDKINLGAGVYRDERGQTPILAAVKEAERRIWQDEVSKTYLPIEGDPKFTSHVKRLVLGRDQPLLDSPRLVGIQTPGGTGGLRLAANLLKRIRQDCVVWIPDPTWVNHLPICRAAGLGTRSYPYLDSERRSFDIERTLYTLGAAQTGDAIILHGCCHNPSGIDPSPEQWQQLAQMLRQRGIVPLVDFAYLGLGQGLIHDRVGILALAEELDELMICTSFSKNFALYNERVGALLLATRSVETSTAVLSQLEAVARVTYSNPPAHGAAIVSTILDSGEMAAQWRDELDTMRLRIVEMRRLFAEGLDRRQVSLGAFGNHFVLKQRGMFSFLGLSPEQVERLRTEFSIYMVDSSRVNFASMTKATMDRICDAVAQVL